MSWPFHQLTRMFTLHDFVNVDIFIKKCLSQLLFSELKIFLQNPAVRTCSPKISYWRHHFQENLHTYNLCSYSTLAILLLKLLLVLRLFISMSVFPTRLSFIRTRIISGLSIITSSTRYLAWSRCLMNVCCMIRYGELWQ